MKIRYEKMNRLIEKDYISRTQVFKKENISKLIKAHDDDVKKDISDHYRKKFFKSHERVEDIYEMIEEDDDNKMSFLDDLDVIFTNLDEFMDFVEDYKNDILLLITS